MKQSRCRPLLTNERMPLPLSAIPAVCCRPPEPGFLRVGCPVPHIASLREHPNQGLAVVCMTATHLASTAACWTGTSRTSCRKHTARLCPLRTPVPTCSWISRGGVDRQQSRKDNTRFGQTLQPMGSQRNPRWRRNPQCNGRWIAGGPADAIRDSAEVGIRFVKIAIPVCRRLCLPPCLHPATGQHNLPIVECVCPICSR
jgi:hypothetical protein